MNAKDVIKIGRRRVRAACTVLAAKPTSTTKPICARMSIGNPRASKPLTDARRHIRTIRTIAIGNFQLPYLKKKYNLLIGERTAEQIKMEIGSAYPLEKPLTLEVKGRNLIEGVPRTVTIDDNEIREALSDCISTIVNAIRIALERTPPELSADISDRGIILTGGGALIKNLDKRIREETGLPVSIADDPLASVVMGIGKMLSDFRLLRLVSID